MTPDIESTISQTTSPFPTDPQSGGEDTRRAEETACDSQMGVETTAQLDRGDAKPNPIQPFSQAHLDYLVNWLREQGIEPSEPKDELARIRKILRTLPEGLTPSMMVNPK